MRDYSVCSRKRSPPDTWRPPDVNSLTRQAGSVVVDLFSEPTRGNKMSNSKKHKRESPSSLNEGRDMRFAKSNYPKFLIIRRTVGNFEKVNPFEISRSLTKLVGNLENVRKLRDGLLIEVNRYEHAMLMLRQKSFCGFDVTVNPHLRLNSSRGVISSPDLLCCTIEDLVENLRPQGVTDVRRLTVFKDGVRQDSTSCIVTFSSTTLPKRVQVGYLSLPIRPYYPPPLRCFRCQMYGHITARCNGEEICICGYLPHGDTPCTPSPRCVNCKGSHNARFAGCPVFKTEQAIQKVMVDERLPYSEAKRKVLGPAGSSAAVSYATIADRKVQQRNIGGMEDIIAALMPTIIKLIKEHSETDDTKQHTKTASQVIRGENSTISFVPTSVLSRRRQSLSEQGAKEKASTLSINSADESTSSLVGLSASKVGTFQDAAAAQTMDFAPVYYNSRAESIARSLEGRFTENESISRPASIRSRSSSESPSGKPSPKRRTPIVQSPVNTVDDDTDGEIFNTTKSSRSRQKKNKVVTPSVREYENG